MSDRLLERLREEIAFFEGVERRPGEKSHTLILLKDLEARFTAMRDDRLKLDRRIHNQRVALRDNWMIVEQRMASRRWYEGWALKKLSRLIDIAGIPARSPDGLTLYSIGKCAQQLEESLASRPCAAQMGVGELLGDVR